MYESHYLFQFARLWGAKEGARGINPDNVLLGNSQNPLDALLGDIAGKVGNRYFLIEFKRQRKGFADEVNPATGKPHRVALYRHLRQDHHCRTLARFGHFGAYGDEQGMLAFEPYAHAIAPVQKREVIVDKVLDSNERPHELDARSFTHGFDDFYADVTNTSMAPFSQNPELFAKGLGLPETAFKEYVECMYQHLEPDVNEKGEAVLMIVDVATGKAHAVIESVEQLVTDLDQFFKAMSASLRNQSGKTTPPGKFRP